MPWPEEKAFGNEDPFEELERDMLDVMKDGTRLYRKALESRHDNVQMTGTNPNCTLWSLKHSETS